METKGFSRRQIETSREMEDRGGFPVSRPQIVSLKKKTAVWLRRSFNFTKVCRINQIRQEEKTDDV